MRSWFSLLLIVFVVAVLAWPDPASEPKPEKVPSEFGWLQRTFPHFESDPLAYRDALVQKTALKRAGKGVGAGSWEFVGPGNIGGRITDLALHPDQPQTLYASAATGGVFKSENLGSSWTPIFDDQPFLSIGDIAIAPSDPNVIYVGTGEANGGHNNYAGGGLFRSDDAGQNWTYRGLAETVSIGRVIVHPENPDQVWVAGVGSYFAPNPERGVFESEDGGLSWEKTLFVDDSTGVVDLAMRPGDPEVLYATTWQRVRRVTGSFLYGRGSGVYRSYDGGSSWELLDHSRGLPNPDDHEDSDGRVRIGRIGLAISPAFPETMYAYYTNGSSYLGLFRSPDGGDSWLEANPSGEIPTVRSSEFAFSWFFGQVRIHPTDTNRVHVLDVRLHASEDGGLSWSSLNGTHVDHHAMLYHPSNPSIILEGNDGGVALSLNEGRTWEKLAPLPITQFYEIAVDPVRPERLFGGTQDNGTIWTSTGASDDWSTLLGADGFYVLPKPDDGTSLYAEWQNGGLHRIDGLFGNPFPFAIYFGTGIPDDTVERRGFNTPIAMDPFDSDVLYYGTYRIWRTLDAVATPWEPISTDLTRGTEYAKLGTISTLGVSPVDPNVIWVGTDDGKVWVSWDYGTNWNDVTSGQLPFRWITRVLPSPVDPGTAYITFSGLKWRDPEPHVFRTRDLGSTWENITSDLPDAPVNAIAVDPDHTNRIFVGTDIGMFVSTDDGGSWAPLDEGIPAVTIADLKVLQRRLLAGTHGRGMYSFDLDQLDEVTQTETDPVLPATLSLEAPYPNPFQGRVSITATGKVNAAMVYDMTGRIVARPAVNARGDRSIIVWNGTTLAGNPAPSGHYVLVVSDDQNQASVPLVRVR